MHCPPPTNKRAGNGYARGASKSSDADKSLLATSGSPRSRTAMKLQQLRVLREIARRDFNVSAAAASLNLSQPGLSRQIRLLEEELGVELLIRRSNQILDLSEPGRKILEVACAVLDEVDSMKRIAADYRDASSGDFIIAATHTQARYALARSISNFRKAFPMVRIAVRQGTPTEVARMVARGDADVSFGTEMVEAVPGVAFLACQELSRIVLVPANHELLEGPLTIRRLSEYPIVTYDDSFSARRIMDSAFEAAGLAPNIVLSAIDAAVIKASVAAGLGVAVLPNIAFDAETDSKLRSIEAGHLFGPCTNVIGVNERNALRGYMFKFIHDFEPRWDRKSVEREIARHRKVTNS